MSVAFDSLLHSAQALPASTALRESAWVYPIVEGVHVLTIALFAGFAILLDLRILNVFLTQLPVSRVSAALLPRTRFAFVLMVISGSLLFFSKPFDFAHNVFFQVKVVFIAIAALNIYYYHHIAAADIATWDTKDRTPRPARAAALVSLISWLSVVVCGRLIAYNWYK